MGLDIHDMEAFKNRDRASSDLACLFFRQREQGFWLNKGNNDHGVKGRGRGRETIRERGKKEWRQRLALLS